MEQSFLGAIEEMTALLFNYSVRLLHNNWYMDSPHKQ